MQIDVTKPAYLLNQTAKGQVKMWQYSKETGKSTCVLDRPNLIVKQGGEVLSASLAGRPNSAISHFYIGYSGDAGFDLGAQPPITTADGVSSFLATGTEGYLRIPLAFPAAFLSESGYTDNVPYFTTFVTTGTPWEQYGTEPFVTGVKLFSLGLVNAQNPSGDNQDRLFSKVYFGPITYDSTYGLAITWGIAFRAN